MDHWKLKIRSILDPQHSKQLITAVGFVAFLGTAYWAFRRIHLQKSPVIQHIHQIQDNIVQALEAIVDEQRTLESKGISMTFTLISKLEKKLRNAQQAIRNPFLPPFEEGLFIQDLGSTHRLLFNKFNIYEQHLLVTTQDFQPQSAPLTKEDFRQTVYAFKANKGLYFYNSGPNAGASQKHRHIQIFPQEARQLPIFRSMLEYVRSRKSSLDDFSILEYPAFNFQHGLIVVGEVKMYSESEGSDQDGRDERMQSRMSLLKDRSLRAYNKLYAELILNKSEGSDYNLVGCQQFLLLVPRRKQMAFQTLGVNAVGFMGSVLFKKSEMMRKFIEDEKHGYKILQDITYPKI